ncbi:AMP-binding protein, partial [Salarchaeum sp. III]|uniref:AMP-binding protein n=1 Tax=Salarchaeum sp. III TaxID=3107927 RepID=UPI002ED96A87
MNNLIEPFQAGLPMSGSFTKAQLSLSINTHTHHKLEEFAKRLEVSKSTVLLTTYLAILSRYSSNYDLLIGIVNTGVLEYSPYESEEMTFLELVKQVNDVMTNKTCNSEKENLQLLFDSNEFIEGANCKILEDYNLLLDSNIRKDSTELTLYYNDNLFKKNIAENMLKNFIHLLESALDTPDELLTKLSIINTSEKQHILKEWNNTRCEYSSSSCIHQLFEEATVNYKDNKAVEVGDGLLTYQELDERSNQLARYLQKNGVSPGNNVAVCLDRSIELPISLLGVMKAGGTYIPMDPTFPSER